MRIESPSWFYTAKEPFDVALNVDSMVEMDQDHANHYLATISSTCSRFLSINHEFNQFRVCDLPAAAQMTITRHPYWMRKGYAEELYEPAGIKRRIIADIKTIARHAFS